MSRKSSDQGPLHTGFLLFLGSRGQHQTLGHVLRAQELLPAPSAPVSVPLSSHAETGGLGAKAEALSLFPGA